MERLTRRSDNGVAIYNTPSGNPIKWENNRHNVLQKLAEYEDLEEQNRLLSLPVAVGDVVYWVPSTEVLPMEIVYFMAFSSEIKMTIHYCGGNEVLKHFTTTVSCKEIGKSLFLTESEAIAALQVLEEKS